MTRLVEPVQGIWWLPGSRRKFRHGVLQQLSTGHFELTLQTAWHRDVMETINRAEHLTLLGKDEASRPLSLLSGFLKQYSLSIPEGSHATFHFDRVFLGAHFLDEKEVALTELGARVRALSPWLGISGFKIDALQKSRELVIHFSQPEDLEFELEPGLRLVFGFDYQGPTLRRPQLEATLRQEVWLIVRAFPSRSFGKLETTLNRMLNLFSLLIGEALGYESLLANASHTSRRSPGDGLEKINILLSPIAPELTDKMVEGHSMLLRFKDVQDAHPRLFKRWLELYELYHSAFDLYFSVQRRDPSYQEQRFLSVVQSLETLHRLSNQAPPSERHQKKLERIRACLSPKDRKWLDGRLRHSHEPPLAKRLENLLEAFGNLFGEQEERRRLAEEVANTRNYLTHYDPRIESKAVEPRRLTPYIYRLKALFVLCCLLELGLTSDEARQLVEKHYKLQQMVRFGKI